MGFLRLDFLDELPWKILDCRIIRFRELLEFPDSGHKIRLLMLIETTDLCPNLRNTFFDFINFFFSFDFNFIHEVGDELTIGDLIVMDIGVIGQWKTAIGIIFLQLIYFPLIWFDCILQHLNFFLNFFHLHSQQSVTRLIAGYLLSLYRPDVKTVTRWTDIWKIGYVWGRWLIFWTR